jgi:hypothetical protein
MNENEQKGVYSDKHRIQIKKKTMYVISPCGVALVPYSGIKQKKDKNAGK